jgi:actin-related protein
MNRVSKEKVAEMMFETFHVPALAVESAGVLCLYAAGIHTGIAIDCGGQHTKITPISDGYVIPHAVVQSSFGGLDIDEAL